LAQHPAPQVQQQDRLLPAAVRAPVPGQAEARVQAPTVQSWAAEGILAPRRQATM